jgi:hypothetical protein
MTTPDVFTQRLYVLVESGSPGREMVMGVMDHEVIPGELHYRDERAIATALRNLADRFEQGGGFVGPVTIKKQAETLALLRNEEVTR